MGRGTGFALVAACLAVTVPGCTGLTASPVPTATAIPTVAAAGADLVCGMDRGDLAKAMGLAIGRVEDELHVAGGVGSGECRVWPEDESLVNGPLLFVTFVDASSPDGLEARAHVDGDGFRAPDVPYESLDGGAWGDLEGDPEQLTLGATSAVFWGQTVIDLTTSSGGVHRNHAADLAALTRQVAASYELPEGQDS